MNRNLWLSLPVGGILFVLLACPVFSASLANGSKEANIARIDSLFKFGEIDKAETEVLTTLSQQNLNDNERTRLEVLLGSIYIAKYDTIGAYQAFQRAIRIRPDLTLNPTTTSPKILSIFDIAKRDMKPLTTYTPEQIQALELAKQRARGYPVGFFLPGAGLLRQQKRTEGTIFTALELGTIFAAGWVTIQTDKARTDYHKANSIQANQRWIDYRNFYHYRNALWIAVGTIHTIGWLDLSLGKLSSSTNASIAMLPNGIQLKIPL